MRFLLGLFVTAVGASSFAIAFRTLLSLVYRVATSSTTVVEAVQSLPLYARILIPVVGGLLAGLVGIVTSWLPSSHGVGDVMEAVVLGRVRLSLRVTLLKCLGSFCAIATGGSLGREGPLIQFGASLGQACGRVLGAPAPATRALVAAGTAAGFAAAYNTPIAAVLFVVEVVTGVVVLETLAPVLVAVVIGGIVSRVLGDGGPLLGARTFVTRGAVELPWFAVTGVLGSLVGHGFLRVLSKGEHLFRTPRLPLPWRPALGALATGLVLAALPLVAGNGAEPLNRLLDGQMSLHFLALLLVAKLFATTTSVASGSPGGVFTPTMLLGGGVGALWGALLQAVGIPLGSLGSYVLVGSAAAVASTTHAPMMATVLLFEMTGDYALVLPLLLSTAISVTIARKLSEESLYTKELLARGVRWKLNLEGGRVVEREEVVAGGEGI